MIDCPHCEGRGWFESYQPGCCGHALPSGECCGQPIPEPCQEQCSACGGTGQVPVKCICDHETVQRVIREHGTCARGGCPYGGDF